MNRKSLISPEIRSWLYPIALAVIALLGAYGLISDEVAPLWGALASALLGLSTATVYRPARHPETAPDIDEVEQS